MRSMGLVLIALGAMGCSADPDGDGLSNAKEKELGLDPESNDSDNDGMSDGEEIERGTDPLLADTDSDGLNDGDEITESADPLKADTDGDGYRDGDEVAEGKDPADPSSVIYVGGWPYNANKDEIDDPGLTGKAKKGELFGNFELIDQHGDMVELYDFAGHGKYVILDISAEWCGPCNGYGAWLAGLPGYESWDADYPGLRQAIDNGDIYYVSILSQVNSGGKATAKLAVRWDKKYPNENIPVLADRTWDVENYFGNVYFPSFILLDEEMVVQSWNKNNPETALMVAITKL